MKNQHDPNAKCFKSENGSSRPNLARVLGVGLVLVVVALPVLFSDGFNQWTGIYTPSPYAAPAAVRWPGGGEATIAIPVLHAGRANQVRFDQTLAISSTLNTGGSLVLDMTNGVVVGGPLIPDLNGHCCFSNSAFAPNGQTTNFAGTAPGGRLTHYEIGPSGVFTDTLVVPASTNDFTALFAAWSGGFVVGTNSTDTNQTVVYGNTHANPNVWTELTSRSTETVFENRHPDLTVDAETGEGFLAYTQNDQANILKFDAEYGDTVWESFNVVALDPSPDATFNYFQVSEDDGNLVLMAPRDNDTILVFTDQAGGLVPPSVYHAVTLTGAPPGDRQILQLNGRIASVVRPAPGGTGTEFRHISFGTDDGAPPEQLIFEDNTISGDWNNTPPDHALFATGGETQASWQAYDVQSNRMFVIQGDASGDTVRYGTIEVPLFFGNFESYSLANWSGNQGGLTGP